MKSLVEIKTEVSTTKYMTASSNIFLVNFLVDIKKKNHLELAAEICR